MIYTETNLKHLFPEPLNAITSALFLFLALYWLYKLRGFSVKHTFLSIATWVLLVGGIGGILYHGLRKYSFFISLDWLPILILCFLTSGWFWNKILGGPVASVLVFASFFSVEFFTNYYYSHANSHFANNMNYSFMALMVLVPVIVYLYRTNFLHGKWVIFALLSFSFALFFRISDKWGILQVGTHFLWHTFGAVATACMFRFIHSLNSEVKLRIISQNKPHESFIANRYSK